MVSRALLYLGSALLLVVLLKVDHVYGGTTTKEPNEKEQFNFFYDRNTHKMAMKVNRVCYVLDLNANEQILVHTPSGMQQLQLKMVYNMNTATKSSTTMDQLLALSPKLSHGCGHTDSQFMIRI